MLTSIQTTEALARLKNLHSMLTLKEAFTMVTGRKPPLAYPIRQRVAEARFDLSDAATARRCKRKWGVDDRELVVTARSLELFLMRCRKVGFIPDPCPQEARCYRLAIAIGDVGKCLIGCPQGSHSHLK